MCMSQINFPRLALRHTTDTTTRWKIQKDSYGLLNLIRFWNQLYCEFLNPFLVFLPSWYCLLISLLSIHIQQSSEATIAYEFWHIDFTSSSDAVPILCFCTRQQTGSFWMVRLLYLMIYWCQFQFLGDEWQGADITHS